MEQISQAIKKYLPGNSQVAILPPKNMTLNKESVMYQHEPTAEDIRENEEKRKINGYAPNPYCIKCHGFGRVYPWKENGQLDTSRTIPCTAPNCLADAIKVWKESGAYLELKGISSRFQTFEEFTPKLGTEKSLAAFRDLATNPDTKPFLLVYGS